MSGYSLAELLAAGIVVEVEPDGQECDRCGEPDAMVATRFARLCWGCHGDVERGASVGYARLAGLRECEWSEIVRRGHAEGVFDDLRDGELDEALAVFAAEEIARCCGGSAP